MDDESVLDLIIDGGIRDPARATMDEMWFAGAQLRTIIKNTWLTRTTLPRDQHEYPILPTN